MDSEARIPLSNLRWLFSAAQLSGINVSEMFAILEIKPDQMNDVLAMTCSEKAIAVRDFVRKFDPNPALALVSGETMPFGEFGVLDYICTTSHTISDSFKKLEKYFSILIHPSSEFKFTVGDVKSSLELIDASNLSCNSIEFSRESVEFTFSIMLNRVRATTGVDVSPTKMLLKHLKPFYYEEYSRIFQTECIFGCSQNLMIFDSELMDLKQVYTEDSKLHELISSIAETALKNIGISNDIEDKVLQILKEEIKNGKPTITQVADKLNISRQTLHRKLLDVGTSYSNLLDDFRKNMAQVYLRNSSMSIDDISLLLGYSNSSAFHRSFKRLTGTSPSSYRS